MPFYIAAIYNELGIICPQDIEKYRPYEDEDNNKFFYDNNADESNALAARLEEFINSVKVDDEEDKKSENPVEKPTTSKFSWIN